MRLATVTSTSPLQVRRDGDATAVASVPTDVTVAEDDRVLVESIENLVYIIVRIDDDGS